MFNQIEEFTQRVTLFITSSFAVFLTFSLLLSPIHAFAPESTNVSIKFINEDENKADIQNVSKSKEDSLKAATNYTKYNSFSKERLYDELTSIHGGNFAKKDAEYAVSHVKVDYKEQALKKAISYIEVMSMSNDDLYNQLTSKLGDKFTKDEAEYAIKNLPE